MLQTLQDKNVRQEKELVSAETNVQVYSKELEMVKQEKERLKKDLDWVANSAKNSKLQADRAIADLEAYTKILRGMEKRLAEVEIEKEGKEQDIKELRQKMMQFV